MRKMLLSVLAMVLTTVAAQAQTAAPLKGTDMLPQQKTPQVVIPGVKQMPAAAQAPAKVALAANERKMGYYINELVPDPRYGLGWNKKMSLKAGISLDRDNYPLFDQFVGGKLKMIRFALTTSIQASRVFVAPVTISGEYYQVGADVVSQAVPETKAGWNEVTLDNPYTIPADVEALIIGFDFVDGPGLYPLYVSGMGYPGTSLVYGDLGQNGNPNWYDVGFDRYGSLLINAVVEKDDYPQQKVVLQDLVAYNQYQKIGEKATYQFGMFNFGQEAVKSYSIDLMIDGKLLATMPNPVTLTDEPQYGKVEVEVPNTIVPGMHEVKAVLTDVNGDMPLVESETKVTSAYYKNSTTHSKTLVEQLTAQNCGFCYLGTGLIEVLQNIRGDVAWAALHSSGMGKDDYNTKEIDNLESLFQPHGGYPSASFNRTLLDGGITMALGYPESSHFDMAGQISDAIDIITPPAFTNLNIESSYNADNRNLTIMVSGDAYEDFKAVCGADAVMTVYLTESGLVGYQSGIGNNATHNNVLRDVVTSFLGDQIVWNGNKFCNTYNVTLPASWNADNMEIIAFVSTKFGVGEQDKMAVNNCNMVKLGVTGAGIATDGVSGQSATEVARYTMDGRQTSAPVKGVNIVKMSNGQTVKVIVK